LASILPNTKLEPKTELLILGMPPSLDSTPAAIFANHYKPGPYSMKGFSTTIIEHSITFIIYYLVGSISWEKRTIHYCVHNRIVPFHVFLPFHCLLMI
jgi:hypothetical protein